MLLRGGQGGCYCLAPAVESCVVDELRYGVIGTGMMGIEHIENINAVPGGTVSAIADPHPQSRDAGAAAAAGSVEVFTDHRALLESGRCDVVVVATPNMTHIDILRDVLATDLPVLVEKPLCISVDECRTVIDLAQGRGGLVWVGLEYRYMPPVARMLEELQTGRIGPVRMVAIREHRFPFLEKVGNWNRFSRNTGGTLVEKCCHFFDLMTLLTGASPAQVMASGSQDVNHLDERYDGECPDILDNAYVIVDYDNGSRALLDLCMFADATKNQGEISVVGDHGKIEALMPENVVRVGIRGEHWIGDVVDQEIIDDTIGFHGYHHGSSYVEHLRFIDAVRSGSEPEVTLQDGLLAVAIGVAAHRSIDERRPVPMSEVLPSSAGDVNP